MPVALPLLLLALAATPAGKAADPCDAPAEVRGALADILATDDLARPEKEEEARVVASLKHFAESHPTEPLAWRTYLERRPELARRDDADDRRETGVTNAPAGNGATDDREALARELRQRADRRPRDPVAGYAAALAVAGRDPAAAAQQLEALLEKNPRFHEAHLSLAALYRSRPLRDQDRARQHLEALKTACPGSARVARDLPVDPQAAADAAAALRRQLDAKPSPDPEVYRWWWTRALRRRTGINPDPNAPDRPALVALITRDLQRLRASRLGTRPAFLPVLAAGYRLVKDSEGRRWAEDQILRRYPSSSEAARITLRRFGIEHPDPLPGDPPQLRDIHGHALVAASAQWVERWPGFAPAWRRRLTALRVSPTDPAVAIASARGALAALSQHPRALQMRPPLGAQVAQLCRERGLGPADVPGLASISTEVSGRAPSGAGGPAAVRLTVDTSKFPDLAPWADKQARLCQAWFPLIVDILASDGFEPPAEVKMIYRDGMGVPGMTTGGRTLELNADHVRKHPQDVGMLIHELTHTIQGFGGGPGWLTEGIADYIRWHVFEAPQLPKVNPARASYEDGYRVTGAFLAWTANTYNKQLVRRLNAALRASAYDEELFQVFTGKDLDTLWAEWLAAGTPAPMGPDVPSHPPVVAAAPVTGS